MGMFDTIIFDLRSPCPIVGRDPLRTDQGLRVHARRLPHRRLYRGRPGDPDCRRRVVLLTCRSETGKRYYLAVYRGVLVGIEQEREAAEALLRSFNFEKLLLWYHDL